MLRETFRIVAKRFCLHCMIFVSKYPGKSKLVRLFEKPLTNWTITVHQGGWVGGGGVFTLSWFVCINIYNFN